MTDYIIRVQLLSVRPAGHADRPIEITEASAVITLDRLDEETSPIATVESIAESAVEVLINCGHVTQDEGDDPDDIMLTCQSHIRYE